MERCEVCGNHYGQLLEIKVGDSAEVHRFDCFECAIHHLAPKCYHCAVRVLGHGVQAGDRIFCSAHCARQEGFRKIVDNSASLSF